jgi:type VI protein secretion system component VasK
MKQWLQNLIGKVLRRGGASGFSISSISSSLSSQQAAAERATEELKILHADFLAAIRYFKENYKEHYDLPLYLVIGEPHFGKSTLLANSGLGLHDVYGGRVHSEFSTKYCVWLFSQRAVFLDTAGIYTKSDAHDNHSNLVWLGFLRFLHGNFFRNPINGIVVVIDMPTLIGAKSRLQQVLADVRGRLYEISRHVSRLPVFVVFTKTDLLAGFSEFFADLSDEERRQTFGIKFFSEGEYANPQTRFASDFSALLQTLRQRLTQRFCQEADLAKRSVMQTFLTQFGNLRANIAEVISEIPYGGNIELHGLHFVSSVQHGISNDYLLYALSRALQLPYAAYTATNANASAVAVAPTVAAATASSVAATVTTLSRKEDDDSFELGAMVGGDGDSGGDEVGGNSCSDDPTAHSSVNDSDGNVSTSGGGRSKSYFVAGFFDKELLSYKIARPRITTALNRLQLACIGILVIAVGVLSFSWYNSYAQIIMAFDEVGKVLQDRSHPDLATKLEQTIENLRAPAHWRWPSLGLGQLKDFTALVEKIYYKQTAGSLRGDMQRDLEEELNARVKAGSSNSEVGVDSKYIYDTLKTYLMLGNPQKLDVGFVLSWFEKYWAKKFASDPVQQHQLLSQLKVVLQKQNASANATKQVVLKINVAEHLVATVREQLSSRNIPKEELVYSKLEDSYAGKKLIFKFGDGEIRVSKLYSADNFTHVYQQQIAEVAQNMSRKDNNDWVLVGVNGEGKQPTVAVPAGEMEKLVSGLRVLYIKNYVEVWSAALQQLPPVAKFSDLQKLEHFLADVSNGSHQLLPFLKALQVNLRVDGAPTEFAQLVENKLGGVRDMDVKSIRIAFEDLARYLAKAAAVAGAAGSAGPSTSGMVGAAINDNGDGSDGNKSSVSIDRDHNKAAFALAVARFQSADIASGGSAADALSNMRRIAAQQPKALRDWLQSIADDSWTLLLSGARDYINNVWVAAVVPEYKRLLHDTYPFFRQAQTSISLVDFAKFFASNGIMDGFFNSYLRPFVDTDQVYWVWKIVDGQRLDIAQEKLEIFISAALIRKMFYPHGGNKIEVRFTLTPQDLTPHTQRFGLNLGGQVISYARGGDKVAENLVWPGATPNMVSVTFVDSNNKAVSATLPHDPWAWFRLLDKANFKAMDKTQRFTFMIDLNSHAVRYEMNNEQPINPFIPEIISNFRCPEKL